MRLTISLLLASLLIGCDQVTDTGNSEGFINDRIATEKFVDLPSLGCPGGELFAIVPLFDPSIRNQADLSAKLRSIPYSSNRYFVPESWWPHLPRTEQTSLGSEVSDAWKGYRDFLSEAGKTSVRNFDELSEISGGILGLQSQAIELPSESIEAVANDLINAGVIVAAAQPPGGCGAGNNVGLSLASFPGDPRSQPETLIPHLRRALDEGLRRKADADQYEISELTRSSINGFGLPMSFQSVVFQVRAPSEVLTTVSNRWIQSEVTIQTIGFSPDAGLALNIFADNAWTAKRTIRTKPPTEYNFPAKALEQEIAVQVSEFLR